MRKRFVSKIPWPLPMLLILAAACSDRGAPRGDAPAGADRPRAVAQVAIDGGGLKVRPAGADRFEPWDGGPVARGSTLETGPGICSLNFMGSVQVELEARSRLILEGPVMAPDALSGTALLLGLSQGSVRINSSADAPVVLEMPHAKVSGVRSYFHAELDRSSEGAWSATVTAFSMGMQVLNGEGSLSLPSWGVVRVTEDAPPELVRNLSRPGR